MDEIQVQNIGTPEETRFVISGTTILHKSDGPAYINKHQTIWYSFGKQHRTDGPAVEYLSGQKEWMNSGQRHRIDGPALEYANGDKIYYIRNSAHRIDGPASIGGSNEAYYLFGTQFTKEKWQELVKTEEVQRMHREFIGAETQPTEAASIESAAPLLLGVAGLAGLLGFAAHQSHKKNEQKKIEAAKLIEA